MKIKVYQIDNGFYRLTQSQAKLLSIDGKLPGHGYEKKAKPISELNQLIERMFYFWRTSFPCWKAIGQIGERGEGWIKRTFENGKMIWVIHIWEPV